MNPPPPQNQTFSSSPFRALPSKRALVVRRRYLLRGNFSRRWTRVSLSLSPLLTPSSWLKIDYQPSVRVSPLRVETGPRPSSASFPLRFSRALEQKWIVHDVFNARLRPTEIRRTSQTGGEENALTFFNRPIFSSQSSQAFSLSRSSI